jgi:hypothetical protein
MKRQGVRNGKTGCSERVVRNVGHPISPGQAERLLQLAQLDGLVQHKSPKPSTSSTHPVDEQYLAYLINMYHAYEEKNLPFSEQVRVLSLISESWNLTSKLLEEKFNCSSYAIKVARRLNKISDTPLHIEEKL